MKAISSNHHVPCYWTFITRSLNLFNTVAGGFFLGIRALRLALWNVSRENNEHTKSCIYTKITKNKNIIIKSHKHRSSHGKTQHESNEGKKLHSNIMNSFGLHARWSTVKFFKFQAFVKITSYHHIHGTFLKNGKFIVFVFLLLFFWYSTHSLPKVIEMLLICKLNAKSKHRLPFCYQFPVNCCRIVIHVLI